MGQETAFTPALRSCQLRNDFAGHIGKAVHSAIVEVRELGVIQTELVKNCRMEVVDGVGIHGWAGAEFISGADYLTAFDASSSQPD